MLSAFVEKPENDPFRRVADERVTVAILACVRAAGDTWQVDWRESSWDKNGAPIGAPVTWRAMLRTLLAPPKAVEAMKNNPIGLYIDELHWDKVGG
jgi:type IV secretion system protein VirB5